ncbi:MAG TPA: ATP-binding protein [Candidatus Solibacter sp.]|nr:ATP-binding protein [Candidatus Solibacter sp.]
MDRRIQRIAETGYFALAVLTPVALTAGLLQVGVQGLEYVFLYMALVAAIAVFAGLSPSLVTAAVSFLLVDYYFVQPLHTLTIADRQDVVNLLTFFGTAGVVGVLASVRRRALLRAEALTRQLADANTELMRLNREQAEAAQFEIRLARTEQQVKTLQESEQSRQEMLADVSHDLRTPIGTILTASTNLLDDASLAPQTRGRLETIANEARRLNALVSDTLDVARIEADALRLELEPTQLADAIIAAVERLQRRSPEREVEWDAAAGQVMVLADWTRLGQIFDNLLGNADRFGPPGTPIAVELSQEEPALVTVRVVDSGPGVPAAYRDGLFERFVRTPRGDPGQSTGLGLAIVKGLVEAHAGTIALEDREGTGAVFRFTLPLASAEALPA